MYIFAVLNPTEDLGKTIEALFDDANRCKVNDSTWFVRSPRLTCSEVVGDLGITLGEQQGIIVRAEHYDGVADRSIVQKLVAWERQR